MVKYLLECGYEHIKVCAGRDNGVDHLRYVGAQRAMQECAAEGQKLQFVALGMNYEKRKASYDWLVQRRLPGTALFFLSDMYALEAIRFCADKKSSRAASRSAWQAMTISAMHSTPHRDLPP